MCFMSEKISRGSYILILKSVFDLLAFTVHQHNAGHIEPKIH